VRAVLLAALVSVAPVAPAPQTVAPAPTIPASIRGDELLRQVAATYANCRTYRDSGRTVEKWRSSYRRRTESPFEYALVHPSRFRFERGERSQFHDGGHSVYWSDGERVMEWRTGWNEPYDLRDLNGNWYAGGDAAELIVPLVLPDPQRVPFPGWAIVEEPRRETENGLDCWRVGMKRVHEQGTLWIDATRLVIVRFDQGAPFPGDWRDLTTTFAPRLDEPVDESLLLLTPPKPDLHQDFDELEYPLIALALVGAALALLGVRALQLRRPFVVPTLLLLPLTTLPALLHPLFQLRHQFANLDDWSELGPRDVSTVVFTAIVIVLPLAFHLRGFASWTFFGVDESTMFKAVHATLDALGLEHRIKERVVRLEGTPTEFHLGSHAWQGTTSISTKKRRDVPLLRDLVRGIRVCFDSHSLALSRAHCVKYVVGGGVLAVGLVTVDLLLLHRR
jgi:hypothetical protein